MDSHSYILGFVQGILVCEFLWFIINMIIDLKQQRKDMKELERMNDNIETDLRFSTKVCESLQNMNERISKLENKEEK